MPPLSRLEDVSGHFRDLRRTYRQRASLDRVDAVPIISRIHYVVGYGWKSVLDDRFDLGDAFVLPRAAKELAA